LDKNSIEEHNDGFIRVLSKFIPKSTTEITQDNLYTIDINCSKILQRCCSKYKEFNEFKNGDLAWKDPHGDKLVLGVIDQVCAFYKLILKNTYCYLTNIMF